MKIKNLDIGQVKAGPEDGLAEGEFIVYPSTFTRTPDAYGDVVAKGAFLDDIQAWKDSGNVLPGLYGHRLDDPDFFVAGAIDEGEDETGWWVKGAFDLESPKGAHVYRLVKGRRLNQLSFAYDVIDEAGVVLDDGTKANELRRLKRYEFSFVPVGANQSTSVVAIKAIAEAAIADHEITAKHGDALREARDSIDAVLKSLEDPAPTETISPTGEGNDQDKASGDTEVKSVASDEEPSGAKSPAPDEEPKSMPSADDLATQLLTQAVEAARKGSR